MWRGVGMALLGWSAMTAAAAEAADGSIHEIRWLIESVKGAGTIDTSKAFLTIAPDGKVATTIGCNRMSSMAKIDGTAISFGPIAATRMACPERLMQQEQLYGAALAATRSFTMKGTMLVFLDEAGTEVAAFANGGKPAPK